MSKIFRSCLLTFSIIVLIFYLKFLPAQSFDFSRQINPFPVTDENTVVIPYPFLGGFNTPKIQFVDIDGDSDPDLFIQENTGQLTFLENRGDSANYQFEWVTDDYETLKIGGWYRFADIDNDGDYDLITERPIARIRYYRNEGTPGLANFVLAADTLRDAGGEQIPAELASIPTVADINADDKPDLFIGRQLGTVTHYENLGMDVNNLPRFQFVTDTFQGILIIGGGRTSNEILPGMEQSRGRHGANSIEFVDIDADQDLDLFWGDFFSPSIYFLENSGSPQVPDISVVFDEFPPGDPLLNGGYNAPRFTDIDGDGDFDLFVGEIGGAFSTTTNQIENFYFYENIGDAQGPDFILQTSRFIKMLDIGERSIAALVDINADGDFDLFIGNEVNPNVQFATSGTLHFYENTGTTSAPQFNFASEDYLGFELGFNYSPVFVDIDADGDQDLFVGEWNGKINFLENTGDAIMPSFPAVVEFYDSIDVGNNATPAFVDIDADSDFDLFVGEFNGNINFYRNEGSASDANFVLDTTNYLGINVGEYSFPHFTDIDNDGDFDMFVGSQDSGFVFYRNEGTPQFPQFVHDPSFAIYAPVSSTPVFADIDGDGDADLFSGSLGGGLVYYENREITVEIGRKSDQVPRSTGLLQNYPNPFNPATVIPFSLSTSGLVELTIYDVLGREVKTLLKENLGPGKYKIRWNSRNHEGKSVAAGIYLASLKIITPKGKQILGTRKLLLMR